MAQSPFDGTWKIDMNSVQWPAKPEVLLLQNGMYACKTSWQKVAGIPYLDTLSVKVIDDHSAEETAKKDGKVVETLKRSVSSDGDTSTVNWTYSGNPSGGPQTGTDTAKRVA